VGRSALAEALSPEAVGVLPAQWINKAIDSGVIKAPSKHSIPAVNVQPASLDLRLGRKAYRIRASFLPDRETVQAKLGDYVIAELDISRGAVLEPNCPYLIPLTERLELPEQMRARANPKSSTGRLDIFTRVVTDNSYHFDDIRPGYRGRLYLEVVSRTFTVRVHEGLSLNQLRLVVGEPRVSDDELSVERILFDERGSIPARRTVRNDGLYLSLDLDGDEDRVIGLRARRNSRLLDLSETDAYDPADFWEPVLRERNAPRVVLEPEEFYLLLSEQAVSVPPHLAAEMTPYAPASGELRTHYAGFFDPGFGYDPQHVLRGSRAALEVRAHDVPFVVEKYQPVCKLTFERMLEPPTYLYGQDRASNYQAQRLTLSKHFKFARRNGQLSLWALR
jgi:dCTP deaminase